MSGFPRFFVLSRFGGFLSDRSLQALQNNFCNKFVSKQIAKKSTKKSDFFLICFYHLFAFLSEGSPKTPEKKSGLYVFFSLSIVNFWGSDLPTYPRRSRFVFAGSLRRNLRLAACRDLARTLENQNGQGPAAAPRPCPCPPPRGPPRPPAPCRPCSSMFDVLCPIV
jgi:hypothetical protein